MRIVTVFITLFLFQSGLSADLDEDKAAGANALAESRFEEAVVIYTEAAQAYPEDGEIPYRLATALMSLDRLDEAVQQFELAGAAGFQPLGVAYRIARIQGRQGNVDAALQKLDEMAAGGFPAVQLVENESDFDSLRSDARFAVVLDRIRANRYPCHGDADKRIFDFWAGEWEVSYLNQPAGTSSVQLILGDCVVFENWESVSGTSGKSFNYYDAGEDHWRQIWVDDTGGVIEFTGHVRDGVMYYTATTHDPESGAATLQKLTFTPNADGTVRQFWEQSVDDGETWTVAFDGLYVRKSE